MATDVDDVEANNVREVSAPLVNSDENSYKFIWEHIKLVLVCSSLAAYVVIWFPIWLAGMTRHVVANLIDDIVTIANFLALLPLILAFATWKFDYVREHIHGLLAHPIAAMRNWFVSTLSGGLQDGLEFLPHKLEELEHKLMQHLHQVPDHIRHAVKEEFHTMRKAAADGARHELEAGVGAVKHAAQASKSVIRTISGRFG